jgi:hypothetical protein
VLQRERLLLEIEARSNGDKAFDETEQQLENLQTALDDTAKAADGFTAAGEGVRKESKAVANQIAEIEKTYQALADQINSGAIPSLIAQTRDLAQVQKNAAMATDGIALDPKAMEESNRGLILANAEVERLGKTMKTTGNVTKANIASAEKLGAAYGDMGEAAANVQVVQIQAADGYKTTGNAVGGFVQHIQQGITSLHDFIDLIERMADPNRLKMIANLLLVLSSLFRLKGHSAIADVLQQGSLALNDFALQLTSFFADADENFQKLADHAGMVTKAFSIMETIFNGLKIAAAGFIGLGIVRAFQNMSAASANFANIMNQTGLDGLARGARAAGANLKDFANTMRFAKQEATTFRDLFQKDVFQTFVQTGRMVGRELIDIIGSLRNVTLSFESLRTVAGLVGSSVSQGFTRAAQDVQGFIKGAKELGTSVRQSLTPSFVTLAEAGANLSPILFTLGAAAIRSENGFVRFLGTITTASAFLLGGFAAATTFALHAIGGLAIAIGEKLSDSMSHFEEKAQEMQHVMNAFQFTIQGFGKTVGAVAAGTVDAWTEQMDNLDKSTRFTRASIAESIKLLVAEGSSIGVTLAQNSLLLERAADVAAAHGRDLAEVTNAIVKGLVGQGQALQAMGLDVSEASLAHSKFVKELGKGVEELNQHELVQARVNTLFEKTIPLLGAAANETGTIAGANMIWAKTVDRLQAKIGEQGVVTMALISTMTGLAASFLRLPDSLLSFIGTLQDFLSVTLIIIGTLTKYALLITSLTVLYNLLTKAIAANAVVQWALNAAMTALGARVGVQIVAVKSLTDVFIAMAAISRGVLLTAISSLATAFVALATRIWAVTLAVLANPLFWKAAAIAGAILVLVEAFKEMSAELQALDAAAKTSGGGLQKTTEQIEAQNVVMELATKIATNLWRLLKDLAKFLLGGLVAAFLEVEMGIIAVRRAMSNSKSDTQRYTAEMDQIREKLGQITVFLRSTGEDFAKGFNMTAQAAEAAAVGIDQAAEKAKEFARVNERLNKLTAQAFDPENLKISVLGDEFQRAAATYDEASLKYNRALTDYRNSAEKTKDKEEEVVKFRLDAAQAYLGMLKVQQDTVKKYNDQAQQQREQELKDQGKLVEAARLAGAERLKQFDTVNKSLLVNLGLTKEQTKAMKAAREALVRFNDAELVKAKREQDNKTQQKAIEAYEELAKSSKEARLEIAKSALTSLKLMDYERDLNIQKIVTIWKELQATNALTEARKKGLLEAIDLENKRARAGKEKKTGGSPVAESLINATEGMGQMFMGATSSMMGVIGAVSAVLDIVKAILQAIPGILEKAAEVVDLITKFVPTVAKGFQKLARSFTMLFKNFVGNVFKGVGDIVDTIINEILGNWSKAIADLLANGIAKAFEDLLGRLPDMVRRFIVAFVTYMPRMIVGFIAFFTRGLPRIFKAIVKMVPLLVKAIIAGLIEAFKAVVQMVRDLFSGKDFDWGIEDQAQKLVDSLGKGSSELFKVIDEDALARGQEKAAAVAKIIDDAIGRLWDWIKRLWELFIKLLKEAWLWVWNNVLAPIGELVSKAWMWVVDHVLTPLANAVKTAFQWVVDNILQPIANVVKNAFQWVVDNVINPLWNAGVKIGEGLKAGLGDMWDNFITLGRKIGSGLWAKISDLWEDFGNVGAKIGSGLWNKLVDLWEDIGNVGRKIGSGLWGKISEMWESFANLGANIAVGLWNKLITFDWGSLFGGGGGGSVIPGLHGGGMIPTYAARGLFAPKGVDIIPTMTEPGEFIVSKKGVDAVGPDFLRAVNAGLNPADGQGGTTIQITNHFDITTTKPVDAELIDREITPRVMRSMRRGSLDGKRILSPKGVQK